MNTGKSKKLTHLKYNIYCITKPRKIHLNSEVWEIIVYSVHCMIRRSRRHKESLFACQLKQMLLAESKRTKQKTINFECTYSINSHIMMDRCAFPFTHTIQLRLVQLVLYLVFVRIHYSRTYIFDIHIVYSVQINRTFFS